MSTTQPVGRTAAAPPLRVRDQAREAARHGGRERDEGGRLALALLLLTHLGSQG